MTGIDKRIMGAFNTAPPWAKYLGTMLAIAIGPDGQEAALKEMGVGGDVDWEEIVAGKPLHYFNGKAAENLRAEGIPEKDIEAVREAYRKRKMEYPERDEAMERQREADKQRAEQLRVYNENLAKEQAEAAKRAGEPGHAPNSPEPGPQTETIAGYAVKDLLGKSDDELLAMPNVSRNTIRVIRERESLAKGGKAPQHAPIPAAEGGTPGVPIPGTDKGQTVQPDASKPPPLPPVSRSGTISPPPERMPVPTPAPEGGPQAGGSGGTGRAGPEAEAEDEDDEPDETDEVGEPTYGGHPLAEFQTDKGELKSDDEILAMSNVGKATLKKVKTAHKKQAKGR